MAAPYSKRQQQSGPSEDVSIATALNQGRKEKEDQDRYYDDIYFSSGSSDNAADAEDGSPLEGRKESKKKKKKRKHLKMSNDELFYDPNMDEEDERWVSRQRMAYQNG